MTDLIARLRDADTTRRIGESYADTHERRQRDRDEAAARIAQLEAALRGVIGWLEDPEGGSHKEDMREASRIARAALGDERT